MRLKIIYIIGLTISAVFIYYLFAQSKPLQSHTKINIEDRKPLRDYNLSENTLFQKYELFSAKPKAGPVMQQWFFEKWHHPNEGILSTKIMQNMWDEVLNLPSENISVKKSSSEIKPWYCCGPYGIKRSGYLSHFSGRVIDLEIGVSSSLRIAAASGGLWEYFYLFPVQLTNNITSQAIGSFTTDPLDGNHILVGTGESEIRGGTGLWETFDGGTTWNQNKNLFPIPSSFYKIRFNNQQQPRVHAATDIGYFRSDNNGKTWTRFLSGRTSDLAINSNDDNILFTGIQGDGIYKSINGGNTWFKLTEGLPIDSVGRIALALCKSSPNNIYACIVNKYHHRTLGVFKSENNGVLWEEITPPHDFHWGQGWYNNTIGVHPLDPNIVFAGGVRLYRTYDGGSSWTKIIDENVHNDHHAIIFSSDGTRVYNGNDGGISFSDDIGKTWNTTLNILPITQFYDVEVSLNNPKTMIGGSQDNGICVTNDESHWEITLSHNGGDGFSVAVDPSTKSRMWAICGLSPQPWRSPRYRTENSGHNWTTIHNGITPPGDLTPIIIHDRVNPVSLYTNNGPYVYQSDDYGNNWEKLNNTPFSKEWIYDLTVSTWNANGKTIYACLPSTENGNRLMVYDNNKWYERSSELFPKDVWIKSVVSHPVYMNIGYAIMSGISRTGPDKKIFKTENRGLTWENITGNLPNIPLSDIIPHPIDTDKLYLGSEFGCFMTSSGGEKWVRWNFGMPEANIITKLTYIDSTNYNGKFYIVAATYGRGIWKREVSWLDATTTVSNERGIKLEKLKLHQNYPNPFNPSTTIKYSIPQVTVGTENILSVQLKVFDILGREVATLVNQKQKPGNYDVTWESNNQPSGVYFYQLTAGDFVETKKMILLR